MRERNNYLKTMQQNELSNSSISQKQSVETLTQRQKLTDFDKIQRNQSQSLYYQAQPKHIRTQISVSPAPEAEVRVGILGKRLKKQHNVESYVNNIEQKEVMLQNILLTQRDHSQTNQSGGLPRDYGSLIESQKYTPLRKKFKGEQFIQALQVQQHINTMSGGDSDPLLQKNLTDRSNSQSRGLYRLSQFVPKNRQDENYQNRDPQIEFIKQQIRRQQRKKQQLDESILQYARQVQLPSYSLNMSSPRSHKTSMNSVIINNSSSSHMPRLFKKKFSGIKLPILGTKSTCDLPIMVMRCEGQDESCKTVLQRLKDKIRQNRHKTEI